MLSLEAVPGDLLDPGPGRVCDGGANRAAGESAAGPFLDRDLDLVLPTDMACAPTATIFVSALFIASSFAAWLGKLGPLPCAAPTGAVSRVIACPSTCWRAERCELRKNQTIPAIRITASAIPP